ncbi:5-formyltetrahydrofolate cyclo-ligase [Candidatus Liberibacter africanus]|uniref:5-formyltetrahydrofolate cyclo-ligase n=1 Tax=Candidatus Liberibacter africanus PTSAPSY TaxID=1277257 RepID=A0A0G3I2Z3_LIBAF|nr:5-formyltetrahydrofolate cyclo-ligase [Candidatus Liberibacter africanus]AKK20259.1 5-formyltetrahydrofolate cyclo-ligase [Candidatus Liberibacter africanus PTSAPSY]QTP64025.1 5-formyltetrahydrofolate cyclo-ligase [Candidatus Liberibacter africanus]
MTLQEQKNLIRKEKKTMRDNLSYESRHEKSVALANIGAKEIPFKKGMKIAFFYPIHSEVNVNILIDKIKDREFSFCLPAITGNKMVFRQYENPKNLVKSSFGTLSPPSYYREINPDIILMPLLAFDSQGNRIGYGRGYYDRAIAGARLEGKNSYLVGVAFNIQETPCIRAESTDIRLHAILTESRFHQFSAEYTEKA